MARTGNHGIVIPRDRVLLTAMYWGDEMTLPEMAEVFGVTHKSVERAMKEMGVATRGRGSASKVNSGKCKVCGAPARMVRHAGNGSVYGQLCAEHRREHYNGLAREWIKRPDIKAKRKALLRRWYYEGPLNPEGESQWISAGRSKLRAVKRMLSGTRPEASPLPSAASAPAISSRR
jgi:hypothetical protein